MENIDFATLFQGFGTMMESGYLLASARVFFNPFRFAAYISGLEGSARTYGNDSDGTGYGLPSIVEHFSCRRHIGQLFLDPMLSDTDDLMNTMQIDFLQPVYTLTFSNGLIACFVFMGIGTLLDVGFSVTETFSSVFFLALCAELGTFLTIP